MRRAILIALLALILGIAGVIGWLGGTQSGLDFALARLRPILPASIRLGEVHGRLLGKLEIQRFELHTADLDLVAGPAEVDWHPLALLAGTVSIEGLDVARADVAIHPAGTGDKQSEPFRMPARLALPVHIRLQRAALHRITIHAPGLDQPLLVDNAAAAGSMDTRGITVRTLEAHGPQLDISAQGRLGPARPYEAALHAEWSVRAPGWPVLVGQLDTQGALERKLNVKLRQAAPFALSLDGGTQGLFGTPKWQATLKIEGLDPSRLHASWPQLTGNADLSLDGEGMAAKIAGSVGITSVDLGTVSAQLDTHIDRDGLLVKSATLKSRQLPTELQLHGKLAFSPDLDYHAEGRWKNLAWPPAHPETYSEAGTLDVDGSRRHIAFTLESVLGKGHVNVSGTASDLESKPRIDGKLQWQNLQWPLAGSPVVASRNGTATVSGTLDDYHLQADGELEQPNLPPGKLQVAGQGNMSGLNLRSFQANWLAGRISGQGAVHWDKTLRWQANASLHELNPGRLLADYPGKVDASLDAGGTGADWRVQIGKLSGTLRGKPLDGSGLLSQQNGIWNFGDLRLSLGDARASVNGKLGPARKLTWQVDIPQLATLVPDMQGEVHSQGNIQGHGTDTRLDGQVHASQLVWQRVQLKQLDSVAHINADGRADIRVDGKELDLPNTQFTTVQMKLAGDLSRHSLTVMASGADANLNLVANGGLDGNAWKGSLDSLLMSLPELGNWHLRRRASLNVARDGFALSELCLTHDATRICGESHWQSGAAWGGTLDLTQLPLDAFTGFLPRGLQYHGVVDGHADISGDARGPTGGNLDFKLADGEISQKINDQVLALLDWKEGFLHASLENDRWEGEVYFGLADGGRLDIDGNVQPAFLGQPPHRLQAHVVASANDFGLVPVLIPELGQFSGKLNADFTVNGTLAQPTASGTIRFTEGVATVPRLGLKLHDVSATLAGTGPGVRLTGQAQSADDGELDWDFALNRNNRQWSGKGHVGGERFQAMNIPEATVYVTPDLNVSIDDHKIDVDGSLRVPEAKLQPRDFSNAVQPSADQIIVTETGVPADQSPDWQISARVRTILGDKVRFEGFGLSGRITGELTAVDQPNQLTTGQGELRVVDGEYEAYGQKLIIENGRLIFNGGPITEPGLDITATRQVQDVKVGANVRGTLKSPKLTLFSDPSMPDSEVLSYLVIGRPLNQTSTAEQQKLSSASSQLGIAGGALLAGKVGRELGIEEVSVQSQAPGQAALVLGKYLSPRLYVSYGIGLFQSVNTVNLRYTLNSKWTLEAQSGEYSSADLLYTIETGE